MANRGRKSVYTKTPIQYNKDILKKSFAFDTVWLADELHKNGLLSTSDYETVSTTKSPIKDSEKCLILVDSLIKKEELDAETTSKTLLEILQSKQKLYRTAIDTMKKTYFSTSSDETRPEVQKECEHVEEPKFSNKDLEISQKKPKDNLNSFDYDSYIPNIQFILVTQTDDELKAATTFMIGPDCENDFSPPNAGNAIKIEDGIYIGIYGKQRVGLLQVSNCTNDLKSKLKKFKNARYIIALGVCYGFPQKNVKMGDVIISNKISNLGIFAVNDEFSVTLQDHFINKIHEDIFGIFYSKEQNFESMEVTKDRKFVVHQGLIVSSPSPIANRKISNSIYNLHKAEQPYGGETQGCDLLELQKGKSLQIIIIKGVASDGVKCTHDQSWQYTSSKAACYYVQRKLEEYKGASVTEETPLTRSGTLDTEKTHKKSSGSTTEEDVMDMIQRIVQSEEKMVKLVKALKNVERMKQMPSGEANTEQTEGTRSGATNVEKKIKGRRSGSTTEENLQDNIIKEIKMRNKRLNSGAADTEMPQQTSSDHEDVERTKQMNLCGANTEVFKETSSGATSLVMMAKGRSSGIITDENLMDMFMKELRDRVDAETKQTSSDRVDAETKQKSSDAAGIHKIKPTSSITSDTKKTQRTSSSGATTTEQNTMDVIQKAKQNGFTKEDLMDILKEIENKEKKRQTKTSLVVSDDKALLLDNEENQTLELSGVSSKEQHHRKDPKMQPGGHIEINPGAVHTENADDSKGKADTIDDTQENLRDKLTRNRNWIVMGALTGFLSFICYVIAVSLAWILSLNIFPGNSLALGGAVIISLPLLIAFAYFGLFVAIIYEKYSILKIIMMCSGVVAVLLEILAAAVLIIAGSQSERPNNNVLSYGLSSGFFAGFAASLCAISTLFIKKILEEILSN